jgi:hypothetical protein
MQGDWLQYMYCSLVITLYSSVLQCDTAVDVLLAESCSVPHLLAALYFSVVLVSEVPKVHAYIFPVLNVCGVSLRQYVSGLVWHALSNCRFLMCTLHELSHMAQVAEHVTSPFPPSTLV